MDTWMYEHFRQENSKSKGPESGTYLGVILFKNKTKQKSSLFGNNLERDMENHVNACGFSRSK